VSEKALYDPIEKAFRDQGFVTSQQFEFDHPLVKDYRPKADVAAFRWDSDTKIDAVAVEAKPGTEPASPLWALGQATTYQLLFPLVYVAAETMPENLSFSEGVLRSLGLGYIRADASEAEFVIQPVKDARCYQTHFLKQIRPAALIALLSNSFMPPEKWKANGDAQNFWTWTTDHGKVQLQFGVDDETAYCGVYSDRKPVCSKLADQVDPDELAKLLGNVPTKYGRKSKVEHAKRNPQRKLDYFGESTFDDSSKSIAEAMTKANGWCRGSSHVGTIATRYELWKRTSFKTRVEAESRVKELLPHLQSIRTYLNGLL